MQPPIIRDDGPQPVRGFYQRVEKNRPRDLSIVKRLAGRDERKPILSEREPYGDYSDSRSFQNQTNSQQTGCEVKKRAGEFSRSPVADSPSVRSSGQAVLDSQAQNLIWWEQPWFLEWERLAKASIR
jgi:hypothetical protein